MSHYASPEERARVIAGLRDLADFLDRNPQLLDSGLLGHFYSAELLAGLPARSQWVAPDVHPLPALAVG